MEEDKGHVTIEQFQDMIDMLHPCMDDFLYIMDIPNDYYCISPGALERFVIPESQFGNATEIFRKFVYDDDIDALLEDLERIVRKEKEFHNLQYRWLNKDGNAIWINCRGRVLMDSEGNPKYLVGCINEIGRKQKADNVSGLLGESSLQNELKGHKHSHGFILRMGIDDFKEINENKGIEYGDKVLRETATCIANVVLPEQHLYRIVADEFIVADFSDGSAQDAKQLYEKVKEQISQYIEETGYEVFYTISGGILDLRDVTEQTYHNLMKLSEFALSEAKNSGKNKCCLYRAEDYRSFLRKKDLVHVMRQAVNQGFQGFEAHFQPIIDVKKNRIYSAETLLRFESEETGRVSPGEFIPLLEESGLIIPVGKWVLEQAMDACSKIQKKVSDFKISVNLSYIQVLRSNILDEILMGVKRHGLKPGSLVIELTESGFLEADENFIGFCEGLKKHQIPLALDDFGTGYSNFHYLYNLNPSTIKIDRSFTLKALSNDYEYNLLNHMVAMTHDIDLTLCIEGIETDQELDRISGIHPDYIQGFYFGKPCAFEQFMRDYVEAA